MPTVPRLGSGIPLVARSAEIGRLRAALARASAGAAGAVLVSGDAGVGKTRLLTDLAATAEQDGALVLTGFSQGAHVVLDVLGGGGGGALGDETPPISASVAKRLSR